jgi:methyl-accepting chemotaxis protein
MSMRWTIGKKLATLVGIMLLTLGTISFVTYSNIDRMINNSSQVTHTFAVINSNNNLITQLFAAEAAQRGYLMSGSNDYLQTYRDHQAQTRHYLSNLIEVTTNQETRTLINELEHKLNNRFDSLDLGISMYDKGQVADYQKLIQQGVGLRLMSDVQDNQQQIERLEKQLADQRQQQLLDSNQIALSFVWWATLLTLIGIGGGSFYLVRSISHPLHALTAVAKRISEGDLSQSPPEVGSRSDEIAILARAFTGMSGYLHSMAEVAKALANNQLGADVQPRSERDELGHAFVAMTSNLRTLVSEVQEAARQISGSSAQIAALTSQLAASSTETAAAVSETSTTLEEIKVTAQQVNQKSAFVSDSARSTAQMTQHGQKSVGDTLQGMHKIRQQMDFIAESIVRLSEQSMAIGEIITSVSDLAGQSNLLAVNASIEAAKAGEHGKGFAVVAQEVRSLAEQSKESTEQIRRILNDIQKAISGAVMATEQGGKTVEIGVQQSAETETAIQTIGQGATGTVQAAAQILASTNEQVAGLNQVAIAMDNIRGASDQIVISMRQAEEATASLNQMSNRMWDLVERFRIR